MNVLSCGTPSSFSLNHFPLELIYAILDEVQNIAQETSATLQSCSLTCLAWRGYSQKLLFRFLAFNSRSALFALEDLSQVDTIRPPLTSFVAALDVVLDFDKPYGLSYEHLAQLLCICPNVHDLRVTIFGCASPFDGVHEEFKRNRLAPDITSITAKCLQRHSRIHSLSINNRSSNLRLPIQILEMWPLVQSLTFIGNVPNELPRMYPPTLDQLATLRFQASYSISPSFLKWLLNETKHMLQAICFECPVSSDLHRYISEHRLAIKVQCA